MEFLILRAMSTMVPRPILIRANLKDRHKADFQDGKCSFAPIYLKISMTEGGTFLEFLILGAMSTMVSRPIFDIPADYVERVVKTSAYSEFSSWTKFLSANLSQNLYEEG